MTITEMMMMTTMMVMIIVSFLYSCPTDETLDYKSSIDTKQRFSFQAFRFRSQPSKEVYLHCEVVVCHKENNASRCHRACAEKPRYLTKRDITTREIDNIVMDDNLTELINMTTKIYDVSLGPMKVYIDPVRGPPRLQGRLTPTPLITCLSG